MERFFKVPVEQESHQEGFHTVFVEANNFVSCDFRHIDRAFAFPLALLSCECAFA